MWERVRERGIEKEKKEGKRSRRREGEERGRDQRWSGKGRERGYAVIKGHATLTLGNPLPLMLE